MFVVEYIVQSQMCEDCHRIEAKDFWKAVVQVRQKVEANGISSGSWQNNQAEKSLDACLVFSGEGAPAVIRSVPALESQSSSLKSRGLLGVDFGLFPLEMISPFKCLFGDSAFALDPF